MFCPQCGSENKSSAKFCMKCGISLLQLSEEKNPEGKVKEIEAGFLLDNRYKIIDIIERGGMGAVYRANDQRLDIVCAIKEMRENFERDEYRIYAIEKFKSEALILSKLRHPNIPRVSDYFIQNKRYYLAMDYIEGETLFKILYRRAKKRVDEEELVAWTLQLCDVLSYLHHQDPPIIYRDLKPANVMITPENRVFLIDFGIARIFNPQSKGTMIGTQGYSPPEQYRGRVDPRSDLYALGATMHHLLTGRDPQLDAPFSFPPVKDLRKDVSDEVAFAIDKCLKFNPDDRFDTVDEMRDIIDLRGTGALDLSDALRAIKGKAKTPRFKPDEEITKIRKNEGKNLASELEGLLSDIGGASESPASSDDSEPEVPEKKQTPDKPAIAEPPPAPVKPKPLPITPQLKKIPREETPPAKNGPSIGIDETGRANQLFEKLKSGTLKKSEDNRSREIPLEIPATRSKAREESPLPKPPPPALPPGIKPRRFNTVPFGPIEISIPKLMPKKDPKPPIKLAPPIEPPALEKPPVKPVIPEPKSDFSAVEVPKDETIKAIFEEPLEHSPRPSARLKKKKKKTKLPETDGSAFTIPAIIGQGAETNVMDKASDTQEIPNVTGHLQEGSRIPAAQARSDWFMFRGKPSHSGENRNAPICNGNLKWRFRSNGRIYSSPVTDSKGNFYFGSNDGCIYCVSENGRESWRYITDGAIYATPLVVEGKGIFFGSEDNFFYGIDFDGKGLWRLKMGDVINSSAVEGYLGTIIVGCNDGSLYCLDSTSKERWRFTVDSFINSSPCVGPDHNIYVGSWDKSLYAISPSGKLLWNFKTDGSIDSSPAIDGAGCLYFGCDDGFLYSLDHIGHLRWKFRTGDKIYSSPAIDRERGIYFGSHDNYFYNLTFDGKLRWKILTNYWVRSSPSVDGTGNIYTGCDDFSVYSISPDGNVNWKFKTNGSVEASPCLSGKGIVVGSNDGWLYMLE